MITEGFMQRSAFWDCGPQDEPIDLSIKKPRMENPKEEKTTTSPSLKSSTPIRVCTSQKPFASIKVCDPVKTASARKRKSPNVSNSNINSSGKRRRLCSEDEHFPRTDEISETLLPSVEELVERLLFVIYNYIDNILYLAFGPTRSEQLEQKIDERLRQMSESRSSLVPKLKMMTEANAVPTMEDLLIRAHVAAISEFRRMQHDGEEFLEKFMFILDNEEVDVNEEKLEDDMELNEEVCHTENKRYKKYPDATKIMAVAAVRLGKTVRTSARLFEMPSRTLYDRLKKVGYTGKIFNTWRREKYIQMQGPKQMRMLLKKAREMNG